MPPRIARRNVQASDSKSSRRKDNRKRNLDAYSLASELIPATSAARQNRLGEYLDDGPKSKRRRVTKYASDEDGESMDEGESNTRAVPATAPAGDMEEGSDSDGNEWTLGGLREDDDDSELDSDEAFGESDDERFAGFTFRGSSSRTTRALAKKPRSRDQGKDDSLDLDEADSADGGEEDDEFGDEGVDLATMLDDNDEDLPDGNEEIESDDDEDNEDSQFSQSEEDGEGDEDERIARMRDRVDALDASDQTSNPKPTQQPATLTVEDLLADLDPAARKQFTAPLKTRKKSEQPKTLAAPLPPRQQSKLNREVASQKAKEQLDRWQDTVIHNRRAEFLSFPLRDPNRAEPVGKDKFVLGAPQNELEENIKRIMEDSGLSSRPGQHGEDDGDGEGAIMKSEGLAEKKMPIEEVARRRAELRRARELLFREEVKAKRIAKIKSKSYRRVHRKERERRAGLERELLGSDEDEEVRADRKRAEERMNTKHRDSKWAKSLKATNRTVWDDDARSSLQDQARKKDELRERMLGKELHDEDESETSSAGDEHDLSDEDQNVQTLRQLDRLQRNGQETKTYAGLGGMKFMRAAEERRRKQNNEDVERLRRELAVENGDEDEDEGEDAAEGQGLGRAIFGPTGKELSRPSPKAERPVLEEGVMSDEEEQEEGNEIQPVRDKPFSKSNDEVVIKTTTGTQPASKKSQLRPKLPASFTAQPLDFTDKAEQSTDANDTNGWTLIPYKDASAGETDSDSIPEEPNPILTHEQQKSIYHQRAFAGSNSKAAFDAEKAEAVASEDEKEVSNFLPGWGSWTGEGLTKSIRKANNRQRHNPIYKSKLTGVKAGDRKDAKLENVLISEKHDRKGKKYRADILPHEYEKKEQYERSLRIPMGPEWVTKETFQRNTRPRVVVKPGVVVGPMDRPLL